MLYLLPLFFSNKTFHLVAMYRLFYKPIEEFVREMKNVFITGKLFWKNKNNLFFSGSNEKK